MLQARGGEHTWVFSLAMGQDGVWGSWKGFFSDGKTPRRGDRGVTVPMRPPAPRRHDDGHPWPGGFGDIWAPSGGKAWELRPGPPLPTEQQRRAKGTRRVLGTRGQERPAGHSEGPAEQRCPGGGCGVRGQRLWGRVACPHGGTRSRSGVPRLWGAFGVLAGLLWRLWKRRKGSKSCSLSFIPSPCAPPLAPCRGARVTLPKPLYLPSLPVTPQGHKP